MRRVAITTGDPDGVGPEVTVKALKEVGPKPQTNFFVFRDDTSRSLFKKQGLPFERIVVSSLEEALTLKTKKHHLVEIESFDPTSWVEAAGLACLNKQFHALVTGPLSKTTIKQSGRSELGHTEILKKLTGCSHIFQGYLGEKFHVVLATAHIPHSLVSKALTQDLMRSVIYEAWQLKGLLPKAQQRRKPMAFLGLNPHAGEGGLIGCEEQAMKLLLSEFSSKEIQGPLVPDAAFFPKNWEKFSVFIAAYHDQGLIPFKMVHGQSGGAQVSLGLPFIRTSVDHGTAKDLFGLGKANPGSMIDAIQWALRLMKGN